MEKPVKVYTHVDIDETGHARVQVLAELSWAFGWNDVKHCKVSALESKLNKMYADLRKDIFANDRELIIMTRINGKKV